MTLACTGASVWPGAADHMQIKISVIKTQRSVGRYRAKIKLMSVLDLLGAGAATGVSADAPAGVQQPGPKGGVSVSMLLFVACVVAVGSWLYTSRGQPVQVNTAALKSQQAVAAIEAETKIPDIDAAGVPRTPRNS